MECRFCCVRPAVYLAVPTVFGPADLCEVCVDRYRRSLRRRKPRRTPCFVLRPRGSSLRS